MTYPFSCRNRPQIISLAATLLLVCSGSEAVPLLPISQEINVLGEAIAGTAPGISIDQELSLSNPLTEALSASLDGDLAFASAVFDGQSSFGAATETSSLVGQTFADIALLMTSNYSSQGGSARLDVQLITIAEAIGLFSDVATEVLYSLSGPGGVLASDVLSVDGERNQSPLSTHLFSSDPGDLLTLELSLLDSSSASEGGFARSVNNVNFSITNVPEPPAALLLLLGTTSLIAFLRPQHLKALRH